MTNEELNAWERQSNVLDVLTSKEFGEWLQRRDKNKENRGEWIKHGDKYKCSKCFATMKVNSFNPQLKDRFCYFCGADMRGEKDGWIKTLSLLRK